MPVGLYSEEEESEEKMKAQKHIWDMPYLSCIRYVSANLNNKTAMDIVRSQYLENLKNQIFCV